jgi:hypothetical protein
VELYLHCVVVLYVQEELPLTGVRFFFSFVGRTDALLSADYMNLPTPNVLDSCPITSLLGLNEGEPVQNYKDAFRLHTLSMRQFAVHSGIKYGHVDMHLSFDLWNNLYFPTIVTTLRFAMKDLV